jgi:hypothetical protein
MEAMRVMLMESNAGGHFERTPDPQWMAIECAIRGLASRPGRVDLYEGTHDGRVIMVSGVPGVYAIDVLLGQSEAAMLVLRAPCDESVIEISGDEYRADQVVHDIDFVVRVIKELIEHQRFVDTKDVKWEMRHI